MKKKIIAILLLVLFVACGMRQVTWASDSITYSIPELECEITIPSDYYVVTRDTPATDSVFSSLGVSKTDLINQYVANDIYLDAISENLADEIIVTMIESTIEDFDGNSDDTLSSLSGYLAEEYTAYGLEVSSYEIYQHSQAKFIKLFYWDSVNAVDVLQYYTVHEGKAINITFRTLESITEAKENIIEAVVESLFFVSESTKPVENAEVTVTIEPSKDSTTSAFVYINEESKVRFVVPENWRQEGFSKDREIIDAKFVSNKNDVDTIVFGCEDVWGQMSVSEREGYSRADVDNSILTKQDIAEMYGINASDVTEVEYNGCTYYQYELRTTSEVYGQNISVTMTHLMCVYNGWMYVFQFSGTKQNSSFSDFEKLMNSVRYSGTSDTNVVNNASVDNNPMKDTILSIVVVAVLLIICVLLVVLFVSRVKKKKSANVKTVDLHQEVSNMQTVDNQYSNSLFCRKCGEKLPTDSVFCHRCGEKVNKEDRQ